MRRHRRQFSIWGGVVAVKTQSYPALPIAITVPCAAGDPSGVIARMHGQRMRGIIGTPVLKKTLSARVVRSVLAGSPAQRPAVI